MQRGGGGEGGQYDVRKRIPEGQERFLLTAKRL
jgi:hypothetical protein